MTQKGRNVACYCGSMKKYKKCCYRKDEKQKDMIVYSKFSVLSDPRDNRGKRYELMDLFVMTIYGVLNGYDDFDNLAYWLEQNASYFKNLLLIEKTPSHDCLSDIFSMIDPKEFMEIFIEWVSEILESRTGTIIAIDGKAIKSARDKISGGNTPYILSAYLSELGISIGQVEVEKKSNEIKAIPDLLDLLDITDCYITIDAMGTQDDIAKKIISLNGHFVLKVKGNQPTLCNDLTSYFEDNLNVSKDITMKETDFEKNHGREEYREYYLSSDTRCITNKKRWSMVSSIGMIRVYRKEYGELKISDHFYIMDTDLNIEMFMKATRSHWNIECGLHWRLDVILNEDRSRNRVQHSISNLSIIRKIVFNLVRMDNSFGKLTFEKKMTKYKSDFSYIENLIFNVIPKISF